MYFVCVSVSVLILEHTWCRLRGIATVDGTMPAKMIARVAQAANVPLTMPFFTSVLFNFLPNLWSISRILQFSLFWWIVEPRNILDGKPWMVNFISIPVLNLATPFILLKNQIINSLYYTMTKEVIIVICDKTLNSNICDKICIHFAINIY